MSNPKKKNSSVHKVDHNAASNLLDFQWSESEQSLPLSSTNDLQAYLLHVCDLKYGCEMSEQEEELERTTWLNREAMRVHWSDFQILIGSANSFALSLIETHFLEALGMGAGLEPASKAARPSPEIPYAPIALPDPSPLDISRYEESCGGPHVFGARLLWWCAAAKTPEAFGYSPAFTNQLASQPFWFRVKDSMEIVPRSRPLNLMKQAVTHVLDFKPQANEPIKVMRPDGPREGYRFQLDGKEIELTKNNSRALTILWRNRQHRMRKRDFVSEMWDRVTSDGTVSSLVSRLNKQLADQNLCHWTVRTEGDLIELVNEAPQ